MKATDFSGNKCGYRYEKEYQSQFRDCVSFYIDGKLKFERFCYGEGACLVFGAFGTLSENGEIIYKTPFNSEVKPEVLPKKLTSCESEILYFDESPKKWSLSAKLDQDKLNGYTKLNCIFKKIFAKN